MYSTHPLVTPTPAYLKKDLARVIKVFSPGTSNVSEEAEINNVHPVASYSWIDEKTPTIAVPCTVQGLARLLR